MKQGRVTGITIAAINLILVIVCGILYMGKDREKPRFEFEASETVYQEGMDTTKLLEGVSAYDTVDGDISDRIVIEKITGNLTGDYGKASGGESAGGAGKDSVTVFYAVSDKAGNVAKASRVFDAAPDKEEGGEAGFQADYFLEAGIDAELGGRIQDGQIQNGLEPEGQNMSMSMTTLSEDSVPPTALPEPSAGAEALPGDGTKPTASPVVEELPAVPVAVPTAVAVDIPAENHRQERRAQEQRTENTGTIDNVETIESSAAPVLTLKVSEVRVKAGQGPAWVDLIGTLSDDRDNYETLFRNLSVDRYDRDKPGSYQVNVRTEDSDGNTSQSVPLTIIVE